MHVKAIRVLHWTCHRVVEGGCVITYWPVARHYSIPRNVDVGRHVFVSLARLTIHNREISTHLHFSLLQKI